MFATWQPAWICPKTWCHTTWASCGRWDWSSSAPALGELLSGMGAKVVAYHIIPDERDEIMAQLVELADEQGVDLIMTTGSTGPSPRDVTPEATRAVVEREMPGLTELMRLEGYRKHTPFAVLSRAVAGVRGKTLIVNLPGNPQAVQESMELLTPLLPAALALIGGGSPLDGICEPP
ncbi:MAG TPA: MogA/MoaB family molybdenum cofactor biosynthesis protein [Anaerolineae bacterium]|nr:MogA/MoaB family molybdenum cofactor biosynthesis protein [Anaerolineae bacterium]